ncbi:MAG TPA: hypothetical protein VFJ19_19835 [Nocardioidaceae bacterium]|nr:hypothetical protein [Nocardioidaceae bacterium]
MTEDRTWTTEFYEDNAGRRPVETWMASLTDAEFMALRAGIVRFLEVHGLGLASTPWLKALGDGLHEFRVRHDASTIEGLAGHEPGAGLPTQKRILLRLFVHFHGNKVVLLLHGYDKGGDDSPRQQNKEIQEARKRLVHWKAAETKRSKEQRKKR